MGSLYRPKLKSGHSASVWWAKYYVAGKPVRVSTGTTKKTEAEPFLKDREGRVAVGEPVLPRVDRIQYDELRDDLRRYYATTGKRDVKEADTRLHHLDAFFARYRVSAIQPAVFRATSSSASNRAPPTPP